MNQYIDTYKIYIQEVKPYIGQNMMSEFWIHVLVLKVTAACGAVFSNITNKVVSDLLDLLNIAAPIYASVTDVCQ